MTQEKKPQDKATDDQKRAFNQLSQFAPPRKVEQPTQPTTLKEAMELSEDLTDFQSAIRLLNPKMLDENSVMIGRIDPGIFLAGLHLMSVNEIMQSDPEKEIDVSQIYFNNYVRLSIGLDGKGRVDTAELLGAAREEKKARELLSMGRMP